MLFGIKIKYLLQTIINGLFLSHPPCLTLLQISFTLLHIRVHRLSQWIRAYTWSRVEIIQGRIWAFNTTIFLFHLGLLHCLLLLFKLNNLSMKLLDHLLKTLFPIKVLDLPTCQQLLTISHTIFQIKNQTISWINLRFLYFANTLALPITFANIVLKFSRPINKYDKLTSHILSGLKYSILLSKESLKSLKKLLFCEKWLSVLILVNCRKKLL